MASNFTAARGLFQEEVARSRGLPDPAAATPAMSDADLACIRRKIPFLAEFSDDFIHSKPMETLLKIETTSIKIREMERVRDTDDKLASNKMALSSTSTQVNAGQDNRWTVLHHARFLPGAACSAAKLWLAAREVIGLTGPPPPPATTTLRRWGWVDV